MTQWMRSRLLHPKVTFKMKSPLRHSAKACQYGRGRSQEVNGSALFKVMTYTNPAEERACRDHVAILDKVKVRREAILYQNQRTFFMDQVFEKGLNPMLPITKPCPTNALNLCRENTSPCVVEESKDVRLPPLRCDSMADSIDALQHKHPVRDMLKKPHSKARTSADRRNRDQQYSVRVNLSDGSGADDVTGLYRRQRIVIVSEGNDASSRMSKSGDSKTGDRDPNVGPRHKCPRRENKHGSPNAVRSRLDDVTGDIPAIARREAYARITQKLVVSVPPHMMARAKSQIRRITNADAILAQKQELLRKNEERLRRRSSLDPRWKKLSQILGVSSQGRRQVAWTKSSQTWIASSAFDQFDDVRGRAYLPHNSTS